ncbi:tRNA-dihydrouridine synthase family protein [Candidatus Pacearchaeota archaeon]|nr:tRNA-dihydrouridine synthase family protein [Candidatus Pacearchaeota archaeon]
MKIRNFKPTNRIFLAPMEEVNDIAFRLLCKKENCGLTYTGMINPLTKEEIHLEDKPALQLFCTNEKGIKEFMKKYDRKVSLWDFNLGCPAKTAKRHGFGAFLHNDLEAIEKILKTMRESTKKPVTIKIRKSPQSMKLIELAEKYCDAVCVHPRTQAQGYSGEPDMEFAEKIKKSTKLPIIYSGDVTEKNVEKLLKKFDFLMVGREAIGKPGIFAKLINKKPKTTFEDYLKLSEKYKLSFKQVKFQAMNFTKSQEGAKKLRLQFFTMKNFDDLRKVYS